MSVTSAVSPLPPPLPIVSSTLIGGSPGQLAMRAQAALPAFASQAAAQVAPASPSPHKPSLPLPSPPAAVSDGSAPSADSRLMVGSLLDALQTTMFTRKKEAIDAFQSFFMTARPRFSRADALLLLFGSPVTPNSSLSSLSSTAAFTRVDRGLLAAAGQLSWKNHQLRASAAKALALVALLLDSRHNADAGVFHALMMEADYATVRLMKLPKHLSSCPSASAASGSSSSSSASPASSSSVGNLSAALRVIDILHELRPDLIDQLLQEKDAATAGRPAHSAPPSAPAPLNLSVVQLHAAAASLHSASPKAAATASPSESPSSPKSPLSPPPPPPQSIAESAHQQQQLLHPHQPPPLPPHSHLLPRPPPLHHASYATAPSALSLSLPASASASASASGSADSQHFQLLSACTSPVSSAASSSLSSPQAGRKTADDWKQRLRAHLSGFFATRMSREDLELKGVLKAPRVFGLSFDALQAVDEIDPERGVPRFLLRCLAFLSQSHVTALPGLFRISGDSREIAELKVRVDLGDAAIELSTYSPHSVAGLLKCWLREMPEPLLTFELYAPLIAAVRAGEEVQPLLLRLPSLHRSALELLLEFLALVSAQQLVNLMTEQNLAICFSPNILRPRVETMQTAAKDTPVAITAVKSLILRRREQTELRQQSDGGAVAEAHRQHDGLPPLPAGPGCLIDLPLPPSVPACDSSSCSASASPSDSPCLLPACPPAPCRPPPLPPSPRASTEHRPPSRSAVQPPPLPAPINSTTPPPIPHELPVVVWHDQLAEDEDEGQSEQPLLHTGVPPLTAAAPAVSLSPR